MVIVDDDKQLANEFTAFMREGGRTLAKLGYNATRFLQMINEYEGVETARRLVHSDSYDGLGRLQQLGRLDMSVEMWVLNRRYEALFDDATRERARTKLVLMDYPVDRELRRLSTSE